MQTLNDVRRELVPRWGHALPLVDMIEQKMGEDSRYRLEVLLWLSGEKSTVHLRDVIVAPFRDHPQIIEIGKQFNPTTEWDNIWMCIDTAIRFARKREDATDQDATEPDQNAELRALPYFGMF